MCTIIIISYTINMIMSSLLPKSSSANNGLVVMPLFSVGCFSATQFLESSGLTNGVDVAIGCPKRGDVLLSLFTLFPFIECFVLLVSGGENTEIKYKRRLALQ